MLTSSDIAGFVTQKRVEVNVDMEKELDGLTSSQRTELKRIVGETLISEIEKSSNQKQSAVNGAAFKKLSKDYRDKKMAAGKTGQPNLHLTDQMFEKLFSKNTADGVKIKITDSLAKKKAENHNHGVTVPKRQFLPTSEGQGFKRDIMKVINQKIRQFKKDIQQ